MEIIRGYSNLQVRHRPCVATMGAFDGVHLGHRQVLKALISLAKEKGLPSVVVMFEPLPREFFALENSPPRLLSFRENYALLADIGVDYIFRIVFDAQLSAMSAQYFIQKTFIDGLQVKGMIVGDDLRFGHNREGDVGALRAAGERYGFSVADTETLLSEEKRISSSRIREALLANDFVLAEKLLGRPYSISGRVVKGQQLGRQLGAATANVLLHRRRAPMAGVYTAEVMLCDGSTFPGVANVGTRPTVAQDLKAILEVHLLDFDRDIYGQFLQVRFFTKIRDEHKFSDLESLRQQIQRDLDTGREYFGLKAAR